LIVCFEVSESGDDLKAVVDGVAAAAALPQYLPVFEPGDDVFDAGPYSTVCSVAVVADYAAGVVAPGRGDRGDAAIATVTGDDTAIEQLCHGVAGNDDVVAVTGPALAGYQHAAPGASR
jgi:hypothetical protein